VNGQVEMAAAFDRAGFAAVDVHMSDLLAGRRAADFKGWSPAAASPTATCSAPGRAGPSPSCSTRLRDEFAAFFARQDTFALGVCNGCQMMSQLPDHPRRRALAALPRNQVEQFEARFTMVEVPRIARRCSSPAWPARRCPSSFRTARAAPCSTMRRRRSKVRRLRYVDNHGRVAANLPFNPNGSPDGIAGVTTADGRFTIMMPHPERVFRTVQMSWHPETGARMARGCACSATRAAAPGRRPAWHTARVLLRRREIRR
jgi:phosphoribosylformylglycinamidine synthase